MIVPPPVRAIASPHRQAIEAAFGPTRPDPAHAPAGPDLVICFTNRCGSNYLAQLLASTGACNEAGEFFNAETVLEHSARLGLRSLAAYVAALPGLVPPHRLLAAKASADQLALLADAGALRRDALFVLLERQDRLAQAVSRVIAAGTGQWSSLQHARRAPAALPFDAAAVRAELAKIEAGNAALYAFLAANAIQPVHFTYETLCADPEAAVAAIGERLGVTLRADPALVTLRVQADAVSARWKEEFKKESVLF